MQLRNLKIGIRAAGVFALLGLLVLTMGLIALYETRKMDSATDEIRVNWMPRSYRWATSATAWAEHGP